MDVEIPVLAGYLNVPTQTGFSLNRISKKKIYNRYCLLFKSSRHGIERLEICENKDDKNPKIFTLENCVKITQEPPPANLIQIVKKTGSLTLNTLTDEDLKEWVHALQTVAFCDNNGVHSTRGAIEEDNDLYCSSFDGLFYITLIPSETSIRCNIEPKAYMLQMSATELQLKSAEDLNVVIAMWPYRFIRKYGYRNGKFTFEAGRKCTTGEGVFTLDHTNPQEVFRCMSAKMKSMKKLISGDSLSSIDCVENQFSAAASMEPGSRSPLPPSPSNQNGGEFEINSTQSCISLRGFISSNDSLNNFSSSSASSTKLNIPNKPPRKLPTPNEKLSTTVTSTLTPTTALPSHNVNIVGITELNKSTSGSHVQVHCDKLKKVVNYEPVSVTTSSVDHAKNNSSTVILKPSPIVTVSSPDPPTIRNPASNPPDLPSRNESANKPLLERDYECIETITNAWKTLGVGDVKHSERTISTNENGLPLFGFIRQRSQSQREMKKDTQVGSGSSSSPKIIDIDIGEGNVQHFPNAANANPTDATYDRLDFLSPNNKTSSGYKTIVTVMSSANRLRCSPQPPNEYELIASPDTEICRKADDSHLGYGILRKSTTGCLPKTNSANNNNVTSTATTTSSLSSGDVITSAPTSLMSRTTTTTTISANEPSLDHRNFNGLNYTTVSKPKRV